MIRAGALNKKLTYVGIEQEYLNWQSLSCLPSTAQAGSDKIKARIKDGKIQAMPQLGGSPSDHSLFANKIPSPGEGGFKTKLLQNVYFCASFQDNAL